MIFLLQTHARIFLDRFFFQIGKIYVVMLIHNGSAIAQMFTLFSNFFLGYKILKECEKYPDRHIGLGNLPKVILHRFIR